MSLRLTVINVQPKLYDNLYTDLKYTWGGNTLRKDFSKLTIFLEANEGICRLAKNEYFSFLYRVLDVYFIFVQNHLIMDVLKTCVVCI